MQLGLLRAAVAGRDLDQDVLGRRLGILHEHVEVAVLLEDPGVEELVLHLVAAAPPVRLHQVGVGIGRLRVLVQELHVRVGRRAVEVEVVLLDVLAVVAFAVREPEEPLLQDRVLAVPQGEGEAEVLLVVGDPSQAVLAPAIRPGTGVIMGEEVPGIAVVAVVLPHRPPLPVREIRSPFPPGDLLGPGFFQTTLLDVHLRPPWLSEPLPSFTSTLRTDSPHALRHRLTPCLSRVLIVHCQHGQFIDDQGARPRPVRHPQKVTSRQQLADGCGYLTGRCRPTRGVRAPQQSIARSSAVTPASWQPASPVADIRSPISKLNSSGLFAGGLRER